MSFRIRGLFIMNPRLCCLDYFVQIKRMIMIILAIQKMHAISHSQKKKKKQTTASFPARWWFSTHLKNMSQTGSFPQVVVKIKNIWNHQIKNAPPFTSRQKTTPTTSTTASFPVLFRLLRLLRFVSFCWPWMPSSNAWLHRNPHAPHDGRIELVHGPAEGHPQGCRIG